MIHDYDIAVIGAGVSGLTASMHCAERGATVVCLEQAPLPGGLVANVGHINGFPVPGGPMSGAALVDALGNRCNELKVRRLQAQVLGMEGSLGRHLLATTFGTVRARIVIVASGACLRQLGVPGEAEFAGRGVSQCDWCDGGFFRDEEVLVVGGGDAAFQAALHLAAICKSVTLVVRGSALRARRSYVHAAAENARISFLWDHQVLSINGDTQVRSATLRDTATGSELDYAIAGVFVFVGTEPASSFVAAQVARDGRGYLVTDKDFKTSLAGVYAIGAVRRGYGGDLVTACGEGAAAAAAAASELDALLA